MDLDDILFAIQERNKKDQERFAGIITSNVRLLKSYLLLKSENKQLKLEEDKLRTQLREAPSRKSTETPSEEHYQERLKIQDELTTLLRERGLKNQEIIDLKNQVDDLGKRINQQKTDLLVKESSVQDLNDKIEHLESQVDELTATNQMLKDEQQALQLEFVCMQDKYSNLQVEHDKLIERWLEMSQVHADVLNKQVDTFEANRRRKTQEDLAVAMSQKVEVKDSNIGLPICVMTSLPTKAQHIFDAHRDEVNAVKWSPAGNTFATTGQDRKVKLWEIVNYKASETHVLTGSNGAGLSLDFDYEPAQMVLSSSADYACRVWNISDQRLRHTLTGHGNKVYSARFMDGDGSKVISGSQDKTLRVWDLRCGACTKVHFAGSSCYDVITYGNMIMSGHFDKKVRFWHRGSDQPTDEITLGGRITSLDLSPDKNQLLCCTKESCLKLLDIRQNNRVMATFTAANFHVGLDYTKAVFSPDGEYVCAGSNDGTVFIWNVNKNKIERVLKEHNAAVTACSWNPNGNMLITTDRQKKAILWSDF